MDHDPRRLEPLTLLPPAAPAPSAARSRSARSRLNVYLLFSDDGGATWSSRIRINNPGTPDNDVEKDQFYPCIAVDPEGMAHVFWYDNRDDPQGADDEVVFDLYYARVDGGFVTDETRAVDEAIDTDYLLNTGVHKLGEYIMAAPTSDGAICVFVGTNHPRQLGDYPQLLPTDETIFAKRVHWSN